MSNTKTLLGGLLCAAAVNTATAVENTALIVHASGFLHARGHAIAKLFMAGDDVLGRGRWEIAAPIKDGQAAFEFVGIPKGPLAVVVFHDENDNGVIDHNVFRFPSEPLGFSNGFSLGLLSGLPSFEKLHFEYIETKRIEIEVR